MSYFHKVCITEVENTGRKFYMERDYIITKIQERYKRIHEAHLDFQDRRLEKMSQTEEYAEKEVEERFRRATEKEAKGRARATVAAKELQYFREQVEKHGFDAIKEYMIPLVRKYGTIKDKAILMLIGYVDNSEWAAEDGSYSQLPTAVSHEEMTEIRADIVKKGRAAKVDYMQYYHHYYTMRKTYNFLYRLKFQYKATVERVQHLLTLWKVLSQYAMMSHFLLSTDNEKERTRIKKIIDRTDDFFDEKLLYDPVKEDEEGFLLQKCTSIGADVDEIVGRGEIKNRKEWLGDILGFIFVRAEGAAEDAKYYLSALKGYIVALEDWAFEKEATAFIPMPIRDSINDVKEDKMEHIRDEYYKKDGEKYTAPQEEFTAYEEYLKTRSEVGIDIRRLDIITRYKNVTADKTVVEYTKRLLGNDGNI